MRWGGCAPAVGLLPPSDQLRQGGAAAGRGGTLPATTASLHTASTLVDVGDGGETPRYASDAVQVTSLVTSVVPSAAPCHRRAACGSFVQ